MCHCRPNNLQVMLRSAGLMALLACAAPAFGQPYEPVAGDSGVATYDQEQFSGSATLNGTYFDIRHQTNSGVGYTNGYTQFGAFAPYWLSPDSFLAPHARLILTDNAAHGFNAGLVGRWFHCDMDRIFGAYGYYDYDQSSNKYAYDQVSFGAESLGRVLDYRANVYIPIDNETNFVRATGLTPNLVFFDNRLGFLGTQLSERPMAGGDAELGFPLWPGLPWLRGYAGGYTYRKDNNDLLGGVRGRVEGQITQNLSLQTMITSDSEFGTNVNFIADWRFSGFQPVRFFPNWSVRERMLIPVQRHWRITMGEFEEEARVAANNPRDGQPYFVVWVDPDNVNPNSGSGTFEDPYGSLPGSVPNETDMVMVARGDSTALTPSLGSITLPDFARLLGEGNAHVVDATANFGPYSMSVDNALLPDDRFRNTGLYPFLSNPLGNIVNVGNHNEISSLVLMNATGAAIAGQHPNGFHFHHLEITGNLGGGIILADARGVGTVTADGQHINGGQISNININLVPGWLNPLGLGNNGPVGGINIQTGPAGAGNLELFLSDVSMNAAPGLQGFGIRLATDEADLLVAMEDISTSGGNVVAGISIEQGVGRVDAFLGNADSLIPSIISSNNLGAGIRLLTGFDNPMHVFGTDISANFNAGDNLQILALGTADFLGNFHASTFNNSLLGSGIVLEMATGTKTLGLEGVTAVGNAARGVHLHSLGGNLNFGALDLNASLNVGHNLNIDLLNTTFHGAVASNPVLPLSHFDNSLTGAGINMLAVNSTSFLSLSGITANVNPLGGVNLAAVGGSMDFLANDLTASGNLATNLNINLTAANFAGLITSDPVNAIFSTFDNSTLGSGIALTALGGNATLQMRDIRANSNTLDGLSITALGGAQIGNSANAVWDGVIVQDSILTGNGGMGINQTVAGGSYLEVFVDPTNLSNNGFHGSRFQVLGGSTFVALYDQVTLNANGQNPLALEPLPIGGRGRGMLGIVDGPGSVADVAVQNSTILGSTDDGVYLTTNNGGEASLLLRNVDIRDSGVLTPLASGVELNALAGLGGPSTITLTMDGTTTLSNTNPIGPAFFGLSVTAAGPGTVVNVNADGTTFDNTVGHAVQTLALLGSTVNFEFLGTSATGGAADGLNALITAGSVFNACLEDVHFDGFAGVGMRMVTTGPLAVSNVHLEDSSANENVQGGLFAQALLGGELNLRTVGSSFDDNGIVGPPPVDGVFVEAAGPGSIARLLFNTTSADGNTRNGFNFESAFGAYMTARIDSISAQNNGNYGVRLNVTGLPNDNTFGILIPEGTNTVLNNGAGAYQINYNGGSLAQVVLTGSFNSQPSDGVEVNIANVTDAFVSVLGNGADRIDANAGDGIDINITNADQAGVFISGYSSISVNQGHGIYIGLDNITTAAAIQIDGPTNMVANQDDGVSIDLTDVVLGLVTPPAGLNPLSVITLTDNRIFNDCLPQPVDVNFNFAAISPISNGVQVDGLYIRHAPQGVAGQDGIAILGNHVTGTGEVLLTNNVIENYYNGINASFGAVGGASSFGGLAIGNSTINTNTVSGINIDLDASGAPITIVNTNITNSNGTGLNIGLNNVIGDHDILIGNTNVANSNGRGVSIEGTGDVGDASLLDVSATNSNAGDGLAVVLANSNVGSVTIDGLNTSQVQNSAGNGILVDLSNSTLSGNILLTRNNVNLSDDHGIRLNVDGVLGAPDVSVTNSTVTNSGNVGINFTGVAATLGTVTFDPLVITNSGEDGLRADLTNAQLDALIIDAVTATNSADDGVNVILNGTFGAPDISLTNITTNLSGNRGVRVVGLATFGNNISLGDITLTNVTANDSIAGHGVLIDLAAAVAATASVGDISLTDVSASSSGQDGIRIGLNTMSVGSLTATDTTVSDSGDRGLNVILNAVTGLPDITITDATATNSGGRGVSVAGTGGALGDVTLTDVSSDTTATEEGVAAAFSGGTVGAINLNNVSATDSAGAGILVNLLNQTVGATVAVNGQGTASSTNNGGDGILVNLNTVVGTPDVSVTEYNLVDNNAGRGIAVLTNGSTVGDVTVSDNIVSNSLGGQGELINLTNSVVGSVTAANNTISDSFGRGLDVILNGVTGTPDVTITNAIVTNSGGRGVSVSGVGSAANPFALGDITLTDVSSDTTTAGEGVAVVFSADALANGNVGLITLNNVSGNDSATTGVLVNLNTVTLTGLNPGVTLDGQGTATADDNGADGILVSLTGVAGTPDLTVSNYDSVDNNAGRGIRVLVPNTNVDDVTVSGNNVSNSLGGQGILVDLTNRTVGSVTMDGDTISDSDGRGLDLILNGVTGAPDITLSDIAVTNSGGRGVSVAGTGSAANPLVLGDVTLTNVSSDVTTADEGVAVVFSADALANGSVGSIVLDNVSGNDSDTTGVLVNLNTIALTGLNPVVTIDGQGTATANDNGDDGVRMNLVNITGTPDVSIDGYLLVDGNDNRGIVLLTNGNTVGDVSVSNNQTVSNSGSATNDEAQGILIDLTNSVIGSLTVAGDVNNRNVIENSFGRGLDIVLDGVTGGANPAPNIVINNLDVSNSGIGTITGRGVSIGGVGSAANQMELGTITMTNVSSNVTGAEDGIRIELSADAVANGKVGDITQTNVTANDSFGMNILTTLNTMTIDPSITIDGQGTATANNGGDGGIGVVLTNVVGVPTDIDVSILGYDTVDDNDGIGVSLTAVNTSIGIVNINENGIHGNNGHGINLNLNASPVDELHVNNNEISATPPLPLLGFEVTFNAEHVSHENQSQNGILITNILYDFSPIGYSLATTRGAGEVFELIGGATEAGLSTVNGNPVDLGAIGQPGVVNDGDTTLDMVLTDFDNADPDLHVDFVVGDAAAASIQTGSDLAGVTATITFSNGETLNGVFGATDTQTFTRASVAGTGNQGDGVHLEQVNSSIGLIEFDGNTISDNLEHGINFAVVTNSNVGDGTPGSVTVSNNSIDDNGGDGFRLLNPDTDTVPNVDLTFTDNDSISGNLGNGINLETSNLQYTLNMTGNTVGTDTNGNTGMGMRAAISGTGGLVANIGDSAENANSFTGNGDAGVGIILTDGSTGSLTVENSSFNGSVNGGDTTFDGVGLGVNTSGTALLTPVVIGDATLDNTSFNENASHGFELSTNGDSSANNNLIQNVVANNNGGDGLLFQRQGNSTMTTTTLNNVTATENTGNGLNMTIGDQNVASTFVIDESNFSDNTASGILMRTIGDADLTMTLTDSQVNSNGLHGIRAFSTFGITDTPTVTVNIQRNEINLNTGSGFDSSTTLFGLINDNDISENTVDGIHTTIGGNYSITNNTIEDNGDDGIDIEVGSVTQFLTTTITGNDIVSNGDDGVALRVLSQGSLSAMVSANLIEANTGDGVQLSSVNDAAVAIQANEILNNGRRGINVVNGGGSAGNPSSMNLTINSSNLIAQNGLEGVYLVNTASTTQGDATNIDNLASAAMLEDGSAFARPLMNLTMDGNNVNSNGQTITAGNFIGSSGLVLRVGTSDASTSSSDDGGFASVAGVNSRGGVLADVTNNQIFGNFASDVTFQPFISVAEAALGTTAGTWTDQNTAVRDVPSDVFDITSYVSDPLARLDLIFNNNTGGALLASRPDSAIAYANDEPEFKSRGITGLSSDTAADGAPGFPAAPDDNGPFTSGTRRRNATRQADRGGLPPTIAAGSSFLYPGMGDSTFRVQGGPLATDAANNFPNPFTTPFILPVPFGGAIFGEEPFAWGSF